ncbi:MAG: hypothetical protein LBH05_01340 [Deferribacteraceae bacterium]|jgi:hypothetical protein|nr:hypothetical protein [Deferribacteraceae bacterium]
MIAMHLKRVDIEKMDYYPFFMDYNFKDARPRGGSAFIDFFAGGRLCELMDDVGKDGLVYVRKKDIVPLDGFFLMDFAKIKTDPVLFLNAVSGLKLEDMFIEDSSAYPLNDVLKTIENVGIAMVSFIP